MRRFLSILICLTLLLTASSGVFASSVNKESKVLFKATEITDEKALQERMDRGLSDDKNFIPDCKLSKDSFIGEDGKGYKIKVASVEGTSQKINEATIANSGTLSEFSGNIVANVAVIPSNGDETLSSYDTSGYNAKLYVHVVYQYGSLNNNSYYKITQLSGKIQLLDTMVHVSSMDINENCFGIKYSSIDESSYIGQGSYDMTAYANSPADNTYYYNNSLSSYYWNLADMSSTHINGTVTGHFYRGLTTWTAQIQWHKGP